ncbi:MAG: TRAP transporter substrate-binding protein [Tissierella sp.]|nr:TRAP transporter substrate-binding protein [Tissierella sp.]
MKKKSLLLIVSLVFAIMLSACSGSTSTSSGDSVVLRLAHTQSNEHPVHKSMEEFARLVKEKTDGEVTVEIFANGVLGDERKYIESLQTELLDMAKVSVNALENFEELYSLFGIPYVFEGMDHGRRFMNSEEALPLYESTVDSLDILGLTWYDAGARNYYTKDTPILKPEDMKGLVMRVQSSQIQIKTAEALGGSATPVDWGELYTAIQQGVVDGADNGIVAFTDNNLGEVAKHFSFTEHVFSPDILLIKNSVFEGLTTEQQEAVKEAARESTAFHDAGWGQAREDAIKKSESIGVTIHYPELGPFAEALRPLREELIQNEKVANFVEIIDAMK